MRFYLQAPGEILIAAGVLFFAFMAYAYWGTVVRESAAQRTFDSESGGQRRGAGQHLAVLSGLDDLAFGHSFALIKIPAFGSQWQFAVVQGSGLPELALGPGHVPGTALPGEVGNFAVAGHRVSAGNPFWRLPSLRFGDMVYVETKTATYEYRLTGTPVWVDPNDTGMLAPVPGHPGERPSQRLMTLITCDPPLTGTRRVIATGVLVRTRPR